MIKMTTSQIFLYCTKLIHRNRSHHRYTLHRLFSNFPYHKSSYLLATNNLKRPTWNKKKNKFIIKKGVRYIFDWIDYEIIHSTLTKTIDILGPLDTNEYYGSTEEVDIMLKEARTMLEASDLKEALEKLDRIPEEYKIKLRDTSDLKENVEGLSKSLKKGLDSEDKEKKVWKASKVFNELMCEEAGLKKNKSKLKVIMWLLRIT